MKVRSLLILLGINLGIFLYSPAQSNLYDRLAYAQDKIKEQKFYEVLELGDAMILDYPDSYLGYLVKAQAYFNLNDFPAFVEHLKIAKGRGMVTRNSSIDYLIDRGLMANMVAESYYEGELLEKNGYRPPVTRADSLQGGIRPERSCYDVTFYDLDLTVNPKKKMISGKNRICFKVVQSTSVIQLDLSDLLEVKSILWNGRELPLQRDWNAIFISFPEELRKGSSEVVEVLYSGKPRIAPDPPWNGGFVWRKSHGKPWVGVACEHLGASCWWPCKDHLSDKPDSMRITVTAPPKLVVISNGNLEKEEQTKEYSRYTWFVSYPINNYLATIYIGNFVSFSDTVTNSRGSYPVDFYVLPHNLNKARAYYSDAKEIIMTFEDLYGEYPFQRDGAGFVEAPYMGMEHQGAIAIGDDYGKSDRRSYEKLDYDYLLVHETAHEWWGNAVTMDDMADAWISEGFATYSEALFMEKQYGYENYMNVVIETMKEVLNIWPVLGPRNINDNSFLGNDIYHKGAVILHNLRCTMNNDSLFFHLIKEFYSKSLYRPVCTEDFLAIVTQVTKSSYSAFFAKFLTEKELPVLTYKFTHENDELSLTYKWTGVGPGFEMPFLLVTNDTIQLRVAATTMGQTITLPNVKSFYIANQNQYPKDVLKNSMTYAWTSINFFDSYSEN